MLEISRKEVVPVAPLVAGIPALKPKKGWEAKVEYGFGATLYCSLLDGETSWVIDGMFTLGLPDFYNGWGCRVVVLRVAPDEVQQALDEAKEEA